MADFSSLKQTIQSYIKQNGNEEITGNILQDVLLAMVSTMGDGAINSLASALQDEITARQNQDATLQGNIAAEGTARQQADTALGGRIDGLQTAVNGINTKLAEGYIYAGIATPSTNPGTPSGKVFYIAVSSGTYTNFSNLTAAQGINILKYNGSAWSKDDVYAIDARPKKNSQNFVTSGGVFDNMGALDVSELNATENPHTLAQYADLSAALAAIPTDYQKGGMSVKFVHSSDNKYVQFRYMGTDITGSPNPFLDTANWQSSNPLQEIGQSIVNTMSQKAITKELNELDNELQNLLRVANPVYDNTLYISDSDGNVLAKFDNDGLSVTEVITKIIRSVQYEYSELSNIFISDEQGNVVLKIDNQGVKTTNVHTEYISNRDGVLLISDANGNILAKLDNNGFYTQQAKIKDLQVDTLNWVSSDIKKPTADIEDNFESDFVGVLMYGQSLSNACYSGPVVSLVCPYGNLFSFKGGVRTYDAYYLNLSGHPSGHTGKAPWITRLNSEPVYGEMIDYTNTLSQIDIDVIDDCYSELIPLVEKRQLYSSYTNSQNPDIGYKADENGDTMMRHQAGEVPVSGILEMTDTMLISEDKYDVNNAFVKFIAECPGFGSATFRSLMPLNSGGNIHIDSTNDSTNMNYFELLALDVYKATEYCRQIGKTYSVSAVFYYHEGDFGGTLYIQKSARQRLFTRINEKIKEITGQTNDVIFIMHQSHMNINHNIIDLQLSLETEPNVYTAEQESALQAAFDAITPTGGVSLYQSSEYDKSKIVLGQPIYGYKYADNTHLTSLYSKLHGAAMGYVYKRIIVDKENWQPIHPVSSSISQVTINGVSYYKILLKFHVDISPLVLDINAINGTQTSAAAIERGDVYGFIFADSNGTLIGKRQNNDNFIHHIEVVKSNTLAIYTVDDPTGLHIHYAYDFITSNNNSNARPIGNLRDSRGEYYKIKVNDEIGYMPVHNWCPSFNFAL